MCIQTILYSQRNIKHFTLGFSSYMKSEILMTALIAPQRIICNVITYAQFHINSLYNESTKERGKL